MFAHLIDLSWRINDLISSDSHELWKYFWLEGGNCWTAFWITIYGHLILKNCIHLNKLIFYCRICLKNWRQIGDFNINRILSAWITLIFQFDLHSFISEICFAIHRINLHLRTWNQLGEFWSTFDSRCKWKSFGVNRIWKVVNQGLTKL